MDERHEFYFNTQVRRGDSLGREAEEWRARGAEPAQAARRKSQVVWVLKEEVE